MGLLEDVIDLVELDVDLLAGGVGFTRASAAEVHAGGVVFVVVVADLRDVERSFEIELGDFKEKGEGLDFGDGGRIDLAGVVGEVFAGEAEFFEGFDMLSARKLTLSFESI